MCGPWSSRWAACACWMNDQGASEKPAFGVLFRGLRRFPPGPLGQTGRKRRKEALRGKARIRRTCRRIRLAFGGLRPSKPPGQPERCPGWRFVAQKRRPAGVKPAGRLLARLAGKRGRAPRPKNPRFWPKCGENAHKSKEIYTKEQETLDRASKKEYNTILHQYAQ